MSFFDGDGDRYEDEDYRERGSIYIPSKVWKFLGLILFFPAMIVGFLEYRLLLVKGRFRPSVMAMSLFIEGFIIIAVLKLLKWPMASISGGAFLSFYLGLCLLLGFLGGAIYIALKMWQFTMDPSVLKINGQLYNFHYRMTPWEKFRRKKLKAELVEGDFYGPIESPLGILEEPPAYQAEEIDDDRKLLETVKAEIVSRNYDQAGKHMIVTGETGSGKTVSMLTLMYNDILNGIPICVIDFKKSDDVLYFLSKWAKENGREFYYFANGDPEPKNNFYGQKATYDPFSAGDQSARTEVVSSLRQWDTASDVYRGRTEALLTSLFFALLNADHDNVPGVHWNEGALIQIIDAMETNTMYDLVISLKKKDALHPFDSIDKRRLDNLQELYTSLTGNTPASKGLKEQLDGIRLLCRKLLMSSYGRWLQKGNSDKHIDLLKIALSSNGPVVLFSLSDMEEKEFARSIGSIILSDLNRVSNTKTGLGNKNKFGVYIDEFQTIDPNDVTSLLEKSRAAKFFVTLASQSLEQIAAASPQNGEATLKAVLDTCGSYLFHAGAKQDSAERMAKILGQTKHKESRIQRNLDASAFSLNPFANKKGFGGYSYVDNWVLSPGKFQSLSKPSINNGFKSEAYFITDYTDNQGNDRGKSARRVQVIAQNEITAGTSQEFKNFVEKKTNAIHEKQTGESLYKVKKKDALEDDEDLLEGFNIISNSDTLATDKSYVVDREPHLNKTPDNSIYDEYGVPPENIENDSSDEWGFEEIPDNEIQEQELIEEYNNPEVKTVAKSENRTKIIDDKPKEKTPKLEDNRPLTSFERMQLEKSKPKDKNPQSKKIDTKDIDGFPKLPDL